jgi:hypothetical protein
VKGRRSELVVIHRLNRLLIEGLSGGTIFGRSKGIRYGLYEVSITHLSVFMHDKLHRRLGSNLPLTSHLGIGWQSKDCRSFSMTTPDPLLTPYTAGTKTSVAFSDIDCPRNYDSTIVTLPRVSAFFLPGYRNACTSGDGKRITLLIVGGFTVNNSKKLEALTTAVVR